MLTRRRLLQRVGPRGHPAARHGIRPRSPTWARQCPALPGPEDARKEAAAVLVIGMAVPSLVSTRKPG